MPRHGWDEIEHKATPEQKEKARKELNRSIWKYRIQTLPRQLWESGRLWWTEGKLGLALADLFIAGVIALVWLG